MSRQQRNYAEWEPSEKPLTTTPNFTCFNLSRATCLYKLSMAAGDYADIIRLQQDSIPP